ncbi:hypothetical protein IEQ34_012495 [Dendrobium chrysotoxum]|uniref:Uncharacterized protein n=1 Tax=Dendrobium chrysotoxum TaxID=161865 RepID=A0AAV7GUK8_DENCH|nr:hypothetical protein IEQ34_012495 [Dendrobium chrysotoxum]
MTRLSLVSHSSPSPPSVSPAPAAGRHADAVNSDKSFQPNFNLPPSSTSVYPFHGIIPNNKLA